MRERLGQVKSEVGRNQRPGITPEVSNIVAVKRMPESGRLGYGYGGYGGNVKKGAIMNSGRENVGHDASLNPSNKRKRNEDRGENASGGANDEDGSPCAKDANVGLKDEGAPKKASRHGESSQAARDKLEAGAGASGMRVSHCVPFDKWRWTVASEAREDIQKGGWGIVDSLVDRRDGGRQGG